MTNAILVSLLTLGELVLVLGGLSVFLFLRQRRLQRVAAVLGQRLKEAEARADEATAAEAPGYADLLRSEVDQLTTLLEADEREEDGLHGEVQAREALALRKRFLEIELGALTEHETCMDQLHARIDGFTGLMHEMQPPAAAAAPETSGNDGGEPAGGADTGAEEVAHLKRVIDNQFQVIRQMRALLEAQTQGSAQLEALLETLEKEMDAREPAAETPEPAAADREVQIPEAVGEVDLAEAASGK